MRNLNQTQYVNGLDSIRFILALIVAFSHDYGFPFHAWLDKESLLRSTSGSILWLITGNIYAGQAAVIVFFIISGFCIHYPYHKGRKFIAIEFLYRRYIRIGIPILVCLILAHSLLNIHWHSYQGLWSLICELIYYSLYPLLRHVRYRFNNWWKIYCAVIGIAIVYLGVSNTPITSNPGTLQDFHAYGLWMTWLLGLPIWLLGCQLAEVDWNNNVISLVGNKIWIFRIGILLFSIVCSIVKYHGDKLFGYDIPYYISLQFFAIAAFFWLRQEIYRYFSVAPSRILEWSGAWSYSLYITHPLVSYAKTMCPDLECSFHNLGIFWNWFFSLLLVLLVANVFFLVVEKPSHQLARAIPLRVRFYRDQISSDRRNTQ